MQTVSMFVICPNCDADSEMEQVGEDQDWICDECGAYMSSIAGQHQWESRLRSDRAKLEAWKAMVKP